MAAHRAAEATSVATTEVKSPDLAIGDPWGWLPGLTASVAFGLFVVAAADTSARYGFSGAGGILWIGLLIVFVPIAMRLASADPSSQERAGLVVLCSVGLYLVKVLHSPDEFTLHDELSHWRTADDIAQSHHLFGFNPLLPISALYPGLEIVTNALMSTGGLSIFSSGVLLLGVAKVLLALALFAFYEQVTNSARLAGLAALLYMVNPSFIFFDGQYAYESLALPLAAFTLVAVAKRSAGTDGTVGWTVAATVGLLATITTHHLTGLMLTIFLTTWTLTHAYTTKFTEFRRGPGPFALLSLVGTVFWIVVVSRNTLGYLFPDLRDSLGDLARLLSGQAGLRHLFTDYAGQTLPIDERVVGYASVALILLGLPVGLLRIVRTYRNRSLALAVAIGALAYPLSLSLRLTDRGVEASVRSSEFLFLAIGGVLAIALDELWLSRQRLRPPRALYGAVAAAIFMGGIVLGWAQWGRLPGPYLVSADARSMEPEGISAAWWTRDMLGPGNRLAADRTNTWLMGSYGYQRPVTAFVDHVGVWPPFFSPVIDALDRRTLADGNIRYLVVDRRLSTSLPHVGLYVERGEIDELHHAQPIPLAALTKFDHLQGVNRLFDSGDIAIYDVEALAHVP